MRYRWPDGKRCAVVFSVDPDAESGLVFSSPHEVATRLDGVEERRFGPRTGVPRLLQLFERYQLPSTWFIPGYTITHYPEAVKAIQASGCEIGAHGNVHEPPHMLDEAGERRVFQEQLEIFETQLGIRPRGYRAPGASVTIHTPRLLKEFGFTYHSNLMGDDIPYLVDTPLGPLVEVPTSWLLNDAPFYRHVYGAPNQMTNPMQAVDQWIQEFRGMHRENGCYVMIIHPFLSGRASRIDALEHLIRTIRQESDVWFATALEVAQWQLETNQNTAVKVRYPDPAAV